MLEAVSTFQCAGILLLVVISLSVLAIEEIYCALSFNRALGVLQELFASCVVSGIEELSGIEWPLPLRNLCSGNTKRREDVSGQH